MELKKPLTYLVTLMQLRHPKMWLNVFAVFIALS